MGSYVNLLLMVLVFLNGAFVEGQGPELQPKRFEAEGKAITLQFVPGDRAAKLLILGKKAAAVDFNQKKIELLLVESLSEGRVERLTFQGANKEYNLDIGREKLGSTLKVKIKIDEEEDEVIIPLQLKNP